jgi:hypothetical protein
MKWLFRKSTLHHTRIIYLIWYRQESFFVFPGRKGP